MAMAEYNFRSIEKSWQQYWQENKTFKAENQSKKPKYYILDMFPYPSGSGLHVGHPLGYIASDIVSRFKRLKGYNVLHPMGFDAFGLPAEQYAIQTGQHPAITTEANIATYKEQMKNIGFSFDWDREIRTSEPSYYKWTQWIFAQLFNANYDIKQSKAVSISKLIEELALKGNASVQAACDENTPEISAADWVAMDEKSQSDFLMNYRLTFLKQTWVNWCPQLGTVLANEEVKNGVSERGGYPVIRKEMWQWCMRISAYADRLLSGLNEIEWPEPVKEMQRNWIGKSLGAKLFFPIKNSDKSIEVFTTRIDTSFGVTFVSLAPEHEWVQELTTAEQKEAVEAYVKASASRSERERMADTKTISGVFTGSYAINPFTGAEVPIWLADYVLAGYGTGAVMAVPSSDTRDYAFAMHFNLPIITVQEGEGTDITESNFDAKAGTMINSGFLNGLPVKEATLKAIEFAEEKGIGQAKVNFRIRDAIFSRQRYWGEPFPVYYQNSIPQLLPLEKMPLALPEVDAYLPTESGEPPLGRAESWQMAEGLPFELNTMPGWAGSSWYFYRYMDAQNDQEFASKAALDYWQDVDLYLGGSEHATGHLLYSRFWAMFLYDLGYTPKAEPFAKLVNQGMIQGTSEMAKYLMVNIGVIYNQYFDYFKQKRKKSDWNIFIYASSDLTNQGIENTIIDIVNEKFKEISEGNHEYPVLKVLKIENSVLNVSIDYVESGITKTEIFQTGIANFERHIPVNLVQNHIPDFQGLINIWPYLATGSCYVIFSTENGILFRDFLKFTKSEELHRFFKTRPEVEKMSKSRYNVVNPDDIIEKYGADTFRLYEMFLGPLEQSKPWNTNGIEGTAKFLRKFWRLFYTDEGTLLLNDDEPNAEELRALHRTINKVAEDINKLSFNTSVSTFMVCVNELSSLKCSKRAILEPLTIVLSSFAPHITEELWRVLGHDTSITFATYPEFIPAYLEESTFECPVSINGKVRAKITLEKNKTQEELEAIILPNPEIVKWLEGKAVKKFIVVPNRMVNIVI